MSKHNLKPMSEVIQDLQSQGYTHDFILKDEKLQISGEGDLYTPEQIIIKDEYRFEGESDPGDSSILYAIETIQGKKGTVVNAYGADANMRLDTFLDKSSR